MPPKAKPVPKSSTYMQSFYSMSSTSVSNKSKPTTKIVQEHFEASQDDQGKITGLYEKKENGKTVKKVQVKNKRDLQRVLKIEQKQ